MSAANIFRKKIRAVKKSKQLALLSLTCNIMPAEQRRRNRSCWTHEWIGRRPELGFTATLVQELENEDAAELRTMFRMDLTAFEELLQMVKPLIKKPGI